MFLKIDYDEPESTLNLTQCVLYSFVKGWCANHDGRCVLSYAQIKDSLPCKCTLITIKRTIPELVKKGLLIRKGTRSNPVLEVFPKYQNDTKDTDPKYQNDTNKVSNRDYESINLRLSTICKDHKLDRGEITPPPSKISSSLSENETEDRGKRKRLGTDLTPERQRELEEMMRKAVAKRAGQGRQNEQ